MHERVAERIRREGPIPFDALRRGRALRRRRLLHPGRGARGGPGATSSPAPRSARCSARWSAARSTGGGTTWASPTRSSWSKRARAGGGWPPTCSRRAPDCARRAAVRARRAVGRRCASEQRELLALEPVEDALGPVVRADDDDVAASRSPGMGPIVTALDELPAVPLDGVVLANELLDNLPFRVVERAADGWSRCGSALDGDAARRGAGARGRRARGRGRASSPRAPPCPSAPASRCRPAIRDVDRTRARRRCAAARLVVVDYAATAAELVARGTDGWLRTYRDHERGGDAARRLPASRTSPSTCRSSTCVHAAAPSRLPPASATPRRPSGCASLGVDELVADARATHGTRARTSATSRRSAPQPRHRGRRAHRSRRPRRPPGARLRPVEPPRRTRVA